MFLAMLIPVFFNSCPVAVYEFHLLGVCRANNALKEGHNARLIFSDSLEIASSLEVFFFSK